MSPSKHVIRLFFLVVSILMCGCGSIDYIHKLDQPIELIRHGEVRTHYFDGEKDGVGSASIGDVVFVLQRFEFKDTAEVTAASPLGLQPFPRSASWSATHEFELPGAKGYVYTSKDYHQGNIGVLLDNNYVPATPRPVVQLAGKRKGRSWPLKSKANFFVTARVIEGWGIRYGGKQGSDYVFEIIDRLNANNSQVIQTLRILEDTFSKGVVVKGVHMKLLAPEEKGIIRCALNYLRDKPSTPDVDLKLDKNAKVPTLNM